MKIIKKFIDRCLEFMNVHYVLIDTEYRKCSYGEVCKDEFCKHHTVHKKNTACLNMCVHVTDELPCKMVEAPDNGKI
jgi:hypothetical protein